jgi:flagellar hook protein FlgE
MGLQSALTTSLTGMQAAETVIDVVGNNVANASTVGFKSSDVLFATQFLQTQSIGSAPTDSTGGTNPRQTGLGVKVAAINPNFSQGTIQISSNPLDVAIQGDGFLMVQGFQGEQLYTRNGQFQTNSQNEIVTATGNRVLGNVADDNYEIQLDTTNPVPISIPFGVPVAQETTEAILRGNLTPNADVGTSGVLTSEALGDVTVEFPILDSTGGAFDSSDFQLVGPPITTLSTAVPSTPGVATTLPAGSYQYRVTWYSTSGANTYESPASGVISASAAALGDQVDLAGLPEDLSASPIWDGRQIYRSDDNGATFQLLDSIAVTGTTYSDDNSPAPSATLLDDTNLEQEEYSYYVTFFSTSGGIESRPTALLGPFSVADPSSRIRIDNIPQPTDPNFDKVRIYRNLGNAATEFYLVDTLDAGVGNTTYIDSKSDTLVGAGQSLDLLGAKASNTTNLVDVVIRNGDVYTQPFVQGTLSFAGTKGGSDLTAKQLTIDATTTVNDLRLFMQEAYGVDTSLTDGAGVRLNTDGNLVTTSNAGISNELGADIGAFTITPSTGPTAGQSTTITFDFDQTVVAEGQGTSTGFVVFDALGDPVNVRLTTVREETPVGTSGAVYRWFATSADNDPGGTSVGTFLASGQLLFDLQGNLTDPSDGLAAISISNSAGLPLTFDLNFNSVTGLSVQNNQGEPVSSMALSRQDGFPTGTLTSFTITESGLIRGVFSNGAERPLGQLLMATFPNATGLQQVGSNMYAQGINSGEPNVNVPGAEGIGTLTAGAVELSNTDIGQNLIDLILASTQYRGGARVITTTQQLFDELLNIRR